MLAHSLFQLAVAARQLFRRLAHEGAAQLHDITVVALEPEVLVFQLAQALDQQNCTRYQHQRERSLCHDQQLLRQGSALCGGPGYAAKRLGRVRM